MSTLTMRASQALLLAGAVNACSGGSVPEAKSAVPLGPSKVVYIRPPSGCPDGAVEKGDSLCAVCDLSEGDEACALKCSRGDGDACSNLASATEFGALGRVADASKARALYERGCSLGSADACEGVAGCYYSGDGCVKDRRKAFEIRWALCKKGKASACSSVSWVYFDAGDTKQGFAFAERGCRLGDWTGCSRLAERCETHRPGDAKCKQDALAAACQLGDSAVCDALKTRKTEAGALPARN